jgi:hypothetical protein
MNEKEFEDFREEVKRVFDKLFVNGKNELYNYIAREIKNECDIQTLLDFLYDKKIIDQKEFIEHRKDSRLFQSFKDENNNVYKFAKYFKDLSNNINPDSIKNPSEYVSISNRIIQRERFLYKKEKMLKRGFSEESEEVKGLNGQIKEFDELIKNYGDFDKRKIKKEEYFLKKEDAEKIYNSFISKRDEVIERIRELPILNDKIHLEPENKSLFYEALSNYWFGNFNASICMLSIFVESFLKEIWYYKKKINYEKELENLINDCCAERFISDSEKKFLQELREYVRNNYIHANLHKIIPEMVVPAYVVDLTGKDKPKPTYLTADKLPTLRSIVKTDIDKEMARSLIIELSKVVESITTRNYEFQYKQESNKKQENNDTTNTKK